MHHFDSFRKVSTRTHMDGSKYPFTVSVPLNDLKELGGKKLGDDLPIMAKTKIVTLSPSFVELGIEEVAFGTDFKPVGAKSERMGEDEYENEMPSMNPRGGFLTILIKKEMKKGSEGT